MKLTRRTFLAGAAGIPLTVAAQQASAATHKVTISGFKYSPNELSVSAGDTIVVTNEDSAPHTLTANDGSFDTGRLGRGDSAEIKIPAGRHVYFCKFHPNMKGLIVAN